MKYEDKVKFVSDLEDKIDVIPKDELILQLNTLYDLAYDRSPIIRSDVSRLLINIPTKEAENILIKNLDDKNELVRLEAVDSLKEFVSNRVYNLLKLVALKDKNYMVRAYAVTGFTIVGIALGENNIDEFIKNDILTITKSSYIKLNCYESLLMLGHSEYLANILKLYKSKSYRMRCAVLNTLITITNKSTKDRIKSFINSLKTDEEPLAVNELIHMLKELF